MSAALPSAADPVAVEPLDAACAGRSWATSSWASRLCGVFVVWQLAFMGLTNFWGTVPALPPEVLRYELADDIEPSTAGSVGAVVHPSASQGWLSAAMDRYSEVTGQWQGWALFAPNVPRVSSFVAVELRWRSGEGAERVVELMSPFAPADVEHYFSPALREARLYNYEWRLAVSASATDALADRATQRLLMTDLLTREIKPLAAYLRWRTEHYQAQHPELGPPDEVWLVGQNYRPRRDRSGRTYWEASPRQSLYRVAYAGLVAERMTAFKLRSPARGVAVALAE